METATVEGAEHGKTTARKLTLALYTRDVRIRPSSVCLVEMRDIRAR